MRRPKNDYERGCRDQAASETDRGGEELFGHLCSVNVVCIKGDF